MRITMKSSQLGSPDGVRVESFEKGVSYDVTDSLGKEFIAAGFAVEGDARKTITAPPPAKADKANEADQG